MKYAEVFLNQTNKRIDMLYDYGIPEDLDTVVVPGVRVSVGFGNGNRLLSGFVVRVKNQTDFEGTIKSISSLTDREPVLTPHQITLCLWLRDYYCSLFYEALTLFTSPVRATKTTVVDSEDPNAVHEEYQAYAVREMVYHLTPEGRGGKTAGKQMNRILELLAYRDYTGSEIREILGEVTSSRRSLIKKGWVVAYERQSHQDSTKAVNASVGILPVPTATYHQYIHRQTPESPVFFCIEDKEERFNTYCLAMEAVIEKGQSACMLFPEIGLTLKNQEAFYRVFGNRGAIYHGRMTKRERYYLFHRVRTGEVQVVMGSRAALFLPYPKLGMIVVDEEMDSSYYAPSMPRFHTLRVAEEYAKITGAQLLISDTIPSITAMDKISKGCWTMVGKPDQLPLAQPQIVDMQEELRHGNMDFLSTALKDTLEETIACGERAMVMLNRRGYASYTFCRDCGYVAKCPDCGVALKYQRDGSLSCGYCGKTMACPPRCPQCGSKRYQPMGLGLDQVYDTLKARYPQWRIIKVDATVVSTYQDFKAMNETLLAGSWDLVLGTRILIKGFTYAPIKAVGALLIDGDINFGDYTSSESAYQLYSRLLMLGKGPAVVQTYEPENETVTALRSGRFTYFWEEERQYRQALGYPPAGHLILISLNHENPQAVLENANTLYGLMEKYFTRKVEGGGATLYKPVLAGIHPGSGRIRYKLLIKIKELKVFQDMMHQMIYTGIIEGLASRVSLEIDPPVTM